MVSRAHFGPISIGRVEMSIDGPWFRWIREHGTLHVPDVARSTISRWWSSVGGCVPTCPFPFVSKTNSLDN